MSDQPEPRRPVTVVHWLMTTQGDGVDRRMVDRWKKQKAEIQQNINSLESSFARQMQSILSNCHELKRTTILDQLPMIRDARHEMTLAAENHKSSLDVVNAKLRLLQSDFEVRLNKIAALIDRESDSIFDRYKQGSRGRAGTDQPLSLYQTRPSGQLQLAFPRRKLRELSFSVRNQQPSRLLSPRSLEPK